MASRTLSSGACTPTLRPARAAVLALVAVLSSAAAAGVAQDRCGRPLGASTATASDCLFILQASVGTRTCEPCVCDLDGSGAVAASDALDCLRGIVGLASSRLCPPCVSTTSTTTTTVPSDPACPNLAQIEWAAGVGGTCASDADCIGGRCDPTRARCTSSTSFDWGWAGSAHGNDLFDGDRWSLRLGCDGPAPTCGPCRVLGIDPALGNCRCSHDNTLACSAAMAPDAVDCNVGVSCQVDEDCRVCRDSLEIACSADGDCPSGDRCLTGLAAASCEQGRCVGTCNCYLGPPLPISSGGLPQCLVAQLRSDIGGSVDVDRGSWDLRVSALERRYSGELLSVPCPYCGGACIAPETGRCRQPAASIGKECVDASECDSQAGVGDGFCRVRLGDPCGFDSDCDIDIGDGLGRCAGFDPIARDGVRGGTCVFGTNHGRPCDVDAVHTSFPAPGGAGHSYDCFPSEGKNLARLGLEIDHHYRTAESITVAVNPCGFAFDRTLCPCGTCTNDRLRVCRSQEDCPGGACDNPGSTASTNFCTDAVCTQTEEGRGACLGDLPRRFCDGVLQASGEPILACGRDADCLASDCGDTSCGLCTIERPRSCFPDPIVVAAGDDPRRPRLSSVACTAAGSADLFSSVVGLPGPLLELRQGRATFRCSSDADRAYEPMVGGCP